MDKQPHYVLAIQSGRHVAAQKLVLPQPPTPAPVPAQNDKAPADQVKPTNE